MLSQNSYGQQVQQFQKQIEQLKREVRTQRQRVSSSSREIVSYCENEKRGDPLISKVADNPFKDGKKFCSVF